jgi:hypothetical protein
MSIHVTFPDLNPANSVRKLFELRAADMQSITDQIFTKITNIGDFTKYIVTDIKATNASARPSTLTAGGIYTAAAKGGAALVGSAQLWTGIGVGKVIVPSLASILNTDVQTAIPIFSLSVASATPATVDIFVYGVIID